MLLHSDFNNALAVADVDFIAVKTIDANQIGSQFNRVSRTINLLLMAVYMLILCYYTMKQFVYSVVNLK